MGVRQSSNAERQMPTAGAQGLVGRAGNVAALMATAADIEGAKQRTIVGVECGCAPIDSPL